MANKDPKRNPSGCLDLTAYKAIENVERDGGRIGEVS